MGYKRYGPPFFAPPPPKAPATTSLLGRDWSGFGNDWIPPKRWSTSGEGMPEPLVYLLLCGDGKQAAATA